ncbi:hypothetical protein [Bacillus toyonensis]|nr:hypothetical protein [Bacillus toyonensis]
MNKGDAILRLLMEIKLELKEVKEQMERMETFKPCLLFNLYLF